MDILLPIARFARWIHGGQDGVPADVAAECWNFKECGRIVPANGGIRDSGYAYCTQECSDEHLSEIQANYW